MAFIENIDTSEYFILKPLLILDRDFENASHTWPPDEMMDCYSGNDAVFAFANSELTLLRWQPRFYWQRFSDNLNQHEFRADEPGYYDEYGWHELGNYDDSLHITREDDVDDMKMEFFMCFWLKNRQKTRAKVFLLSSRIPVVQLEHIVNFLAIPIPTYATQPQRHFELLKRKDRPLDKCPFMGFETDEGLVWGPSVGKGIGWPKGDVFQKGQKGKGSRKGKTSFDDTTFWTDHGYPSADIFKRPPPWWSGIDRDLKELHNLALGSSRLFRTGAFGKGLSLGIFGKGLGTGLGKGDLTREMREWIKEERNAWIEEEATDFMINGEYTWHPRRLDVVSRDEEWTEWFEMETWYDEHDCFYPREIE